MFVAAVGGCVSYESNTDLDPDGPPALAQVRLDEVYTDANGAANTRRVFAYGTLPGATADDEHAVSTAAVSEQNLSMRIIVDQLLRGNRLQQIQCRADVQLDIDGEPSTWGDVPDDATPDDIAKCAVSDAALGQSCIGDNLVCICMLPDGCGTVNMGQPVGVLDSNADGAADFTQFKPGAAAITCQSGAITVPIDVTQSYWYPSGDQQVPAAGGYDALGPAIMLFPLDGTLPTSATCGVTFNPEVISKANDRVCAPPGGRPADCTGRLEDCPQFLDGCVPGDTTNFSFGTQALVISPPFPDGSTGEPLDLPLVFTANAPILLSSIANITLSPDVPDKQISLSGTTTIQMVFPTGLAPSTMYTITFPTTVTDTFGQGLTAPFVVHFTTAAM